MMYFGHIAGILRDPKKEWGMLRDERYTTKTIFLTQISILAAIPAISMFIGVTQFGWSVAGENPVRLAASSAVSSALMFYFAMWAAIAFIASAIFWMQKTYGGSSTLDACLMLTTVTATPLFLSGLSLLWPALWFNVLIGMVAMADAVYLLYSGTSRIMDIDEDRAFLFATSILTVALCTLVGMLAVSVIAWDMISLVYIPS